METIQAQQFDNTGDDGRVIQGDRFTLLGDGIFRFAARNGTCIKSYHISVNNVPLEDWQRNENHVFKSIRQHIEHTYGGIESIFALCADRRNLKLMGKNSIAKELVDLCHFFYNCYTCDNGNSSSIRFGCLPPTLVEYLSHGNNNRGNNNCGNNN